jgi:hypothetical protein
MAYAVKSALNLRNPEDRGQEDRGNLTNSAHQGLWTQRGM